MKKSVLKGVFFGVVLFVALFLFETIMNLGNMDMTAEMASASYPLVYMNISGERVNCLHGYRDEMEAAYMRETITPLENGRQFGITVEKFGTGIARLNATSALAISVSGAFTRRRSMRALRRFYRTR